MTLRDRLMRRATLLLLGSTLLLGGCDPTIQTTVETGIINVTTSALTSFFQAIVQLGQESTSGT